MKAISVLLTLTIIATIDCRHLFHLGFADMTLNELSQKLIQSIKLDEALATAGRAVNTAAQAVSKPIQKSSEVLQQAENVSKNIRDALSTAGKELSKEGQVGGNPHVVSETIKTTLGETAEKFVEAADKQNVKTH
jgi:hypothetical protein